MKGEMVQIDVKMPPTARPKSEPDLREPREPGLRRHRPHVNAKRPGPVLIKLPESQAHHIRFRRAEGNRFFIRTNNYKQARCSVARSSFSRVAARSPSSWGHFPPTTLTVIEGDGRRHPGPKDRHHRKREDNTDRAKARSTWRTSSTPVRLNLVVGLWSYNGPSIAAAIEALNKKGKVLAAVVDEDDGTLNGIASGAIQVTVVQKPFQFGYLSSKWMHELATKGEAARAQLPADKVIDTGVEVISKTNVADFRSKLEEMKKN